ncbi:lymphatic vessel endothelial hyaluronic acid receptor 1 isoform X1 [Myiozetetes cayanensis]|uniref:lymphatic vessel endothelial hyaluronic acid receptor 1 isoform X1 n=1 Tax=Myiozetetes cayanensis TaxID=478635 RepID=UPI00215FE513|nr:lymphatic vessel endothelial hyaluronic acid receptor 1 isoform X1 [Myiozetetes cayanensis]XP_050192147.1 lymphatic vessel endothelial hyaluronic acid receptor 1 isoform X1 [Myiozetetes cayanensis]
MATNFGVTSAVFFIWVMTFMAQNYFVTGSIQSLCRITGVGLYLEKKVNFSEASNACDQLNLQLASKDQVENALKHDFQTCSFGWVKDGFVVIPRTTPNNKCGKGKTGLVRWNADHLQTFHVYCFNSSDVQINSCKPDPTTTTFPSSSAPTDSTPHSASDLTENITAVPTVTESEQFLKSRRFRVICVTETLPTEGSTTALPEESSTSDSPSHTARSAFKNDPVVFGGKGLTRQLFNQNSIPTALLVLAIIFFVISVVLAVCYIKKYKKTFPFLNKNQQKEMVGTVALKEAKLNDKTPEKEAQNNGNKVEESKTKPEATVKCLEAEV